MAIKKEQTGKKEYWRNELNSLGIEPKRENEVNDKDELAVLADNVKCITKTTRQITAAKKQTTRDLIISSNWQGP